MQSLYEMRRSIVKSKREIRKGSKIIVIQLLVIIAILAFNSIAEAQIDANDHVTIDNDNKLVIFHSPVISATFTYQQLQDSSAVANGTATVVPNERVEHFQRMKRVFNDQKSILENWTARQNRIIKVMEQMDTYTTVQLQDMLTIKNWLEKNLGEDPAPDDPTDPPEEGELRTVNGVLQKNIDGVWVDISRPELEISQ